MYDRISLNLLDRASAAWLEAQFAGAVLRRTLRSSRPGHGLPDPT